MLSSFARLLLLAAALLALCSCSFPGVYKLDIQQGNIITQDRIDQLRPGMSKRQVRFLMGTPLLVDSFNENRWDYFYSLRNNDDAYSKERLSMYFVEDQLHHMQGNFRPVANADVTASAEDYIEPTRSIKTAPMATPGSTTTPTPMNRPVIPPPDTPVEVYPVPETRVHEVESPAPETTPPPAR